MARKRARRKGGKSSKSSHRQSDRAPVKPSATQPASAVRSPRWLLVARIGLGLATCLAAYLAVQSFSTGGVAGCGPGSPCEKVLSSIWGYWFGVPVTLPAIGAYVGLLAATFWLPATTPGSTRKIARMAAILGSSAVIGAALWFVAVQALILGAFCTFCCATHALASAAAGALLYGVVLSKGDEGGDAIPPLRAAGLGLIGLALVAGLGWTQWAFPKQTQVLVSTTSAGSKAETPNATENSTQKTAREPSTNTESGKSPGDVVSPDRLLHLHEGLFVLNKDEVPLLGAKNAPKTIVSLYDYTCHYCRIMHGHLAIALEVYDGELSIVSLPMPLDSRCNPEVQATPPGHTEACDYARIGLAVFRADATRTAEFDRWLFKDHDKVRSVEETKRHAAEMIGADTLAKALKDPWIDQQLAMNAKLYRMNSEKAGAGMMPQLIIGDTVAVGPVAHPQQLLQALQEKLGLPPRNP